MSLGFLDKKGIGLFVYRVLAAHIPSAKSTKVALIA